MKQKLRREADVTGELKGKYEQINIYLFNVEHKQTTKKTFT